jgi:cellobiose epimerase
MAFSHHHQLKKQPEMLLEETVQILPAYRYALSKELASILDYWMKHTIDYKQGGFIGSLDNHNTIDPQAPKGIVLNSRIFWTFSAAYQLLKKQDYLDIATRAFQYIVDHFIDRKYGGVYWSVDKYGAPLDARKQIYGLAFCIYGLAEYSKASGERIPLHLAKDLFQKIELYSFDKKMGGYFEAFTQGWNSIDDQRLSEKDENEKKTMNTHLHIIEAYANFSSVCPDPRIKERIAHLLDMFDHHIINQQTSHLNLFMDENWVVKSSLVSYGHDIEAAWLLLECAERLHDKKYMDRFNELSIRLADAAAEGLDGDGGLWYEFDPAKDQLTREKHSWPQPEAMVGFFNAYQLTGNEKYLNHSINSWEFVKRHMRDQMNGEWFWGVGDNYAPMQKEKAGFWKCPYHNGRACIELIKRIEGEIN